MGIPVRIKNSFCPEGSGTRISNHDGTHEGVRAVTSLSDVVLISIEAADASLSGAQLVARALEAAARAKVEVLLLTRSSFRQNFCMLVHAAEFEAVLESLREELALELAHGYLRPIGLDHSVGLLAAVGEGMRGTPGLAGRLFTAISRENVNIIAIAQGSSELTIAIVVNQDDLRTAVSAIHCECGLGRTTQRGLSPDDSSDCQSRMVPIYAAPLAFVAFQQRLHVPHALWLDEREVLDLQRILPQVEEFDTLVVFPGRSLSTEPVRFCVWSAAIAVASGWSMSTHSSWRMANQPLDA